ncbi:MAG TPA: hypothetical protein VFS21_08945 [Roseiflexaceae bacterium]|nr:hypothetical protein [Roseiflexaceae bacterium]
MLARHLLATIVIFVLAVAALSAAPPASAHRDGCHRWHSCPSDSGSYVCGDLGYDTYCPEKRAKQPTAVPRAPAPPTAVPPTPVALGERPAVDWRTYDTNPAFQGFWQGNSGLVVFGLAKTPAYQERGHVAQIFERNRLELHAENPVPYNVQIGLLGEERLLQLGRVWQNEPQGAPQQGCRFFAETGHNLCEPFLSYWRAHGLDFDGRRGTSEAESLALFGYPISEAVVETGADGGQRLTQWFQRARFEDHVRQGVMLGLLGNEVYGVR